MGDSENYVRSWDLASGRPVPLTGTAKEILIALGPNTGNAATPGQTFDIAIEVWNLDRAMVLVESHYWRLAPWFLNGGSGIPPAAPDTAITISAVLVKRDSLGNVVEIGPYPAAAWLNGGTVPDGIEVTSGAEGVRFKFHVVYTGQDVAFDFVASLVLKADQIFGCCGIGEATANRYKVVLPSLVAQNTAGE